jgi:hypothetical protein
MWFFIALFVAALVVSYATMPKAQSQKPAGLSEIQAPVAEDGIEIPVLFGTRDLNGPNVVWYGDLKTVAIKSKGGKK